MTKRLSVLLHPLLFALFPVLALLAANIDQVNPEDGLRAMAFAVVFGLTLWAGATVLFRDLRKGAALASVGLLLWFSYGHLHMALREVQVFGETLGRHRYLVPAASAILLGTAVLLWKRREISSWTAALNVIALVLVIMPLIQIGSYRVQLARAADTATAQHVDPATGHSFEANPPPDPPDVYYIVLDAYGRQDTLQNLIGFDNSGFLAKLKEMGFYVAHCAQSNYSQSDLTLASTLNMAYLDDLGDTFTANREDKTPLRPLIFESLTQRTFEDFGYEIVAFETGFPFSELETADRYLRPDLFDLEGGGLLRGLNGFETVLLRSSGGLLLIDYAHLLPMNLKPDYQFEIRSSKQRTLFTLDQLAQLPGSERPMFVFAHVVSPHRPFVFGPGGEARVPPNLFEYEDYDERMEWYRQGYADQVGYLNQLLLSALRQLVEASDPAPVIILQADHGPEEGGSRDRMAILSAYYLPGDAEQVLYPDITPVNNFRLVLSQLFNAELPLLEDHSLHSPYNRPYDFQEIDDTDCQLAGG